MTVCVSTATTRKRSLATGSFYVGNRPVLLRPIPYLRMTRQHLYGGTMHQSGLCNEFVLAKASRSLYS